MTARVEIPEGLSIEDAISEANRFLVYYGDLPKILQVGMLNDISMSRRRIVYISSIIGNYVGELKGEKERTYALRKILFSKKKHQFRTGKNDEGKKVNEGMTATDAAELAEIECSKLRLKEAEDEKNYLQARVLYDSLIKALDSLSGDLRRLEEEYKKINYSQR